MKPTRHRYLSAAIAVAVGVVLLLWSWNTLARLFELPEARAQHALAALTLLAIVRVGLTGRWHGTARLSHHGGPDRSRPRSRA